MMTHIERMRACLEGQPTDRPPVALWRHFPVDDQEPGALAAAHIFFQKTYDFDLLKMTPASSFSVKDWGVEDAWEGNTEGTRTYTRHIIQQPGDWERLRALDARASHLMAQVQCLKEIKGALGSEVPLLQTVFSPLSQAKHLAGEGTLLLHLRQFPEAVERGLQVIAETTGRFIEEAGGYVDGVFYAVQHAQAEVLSREEFVRFGRPWDLQVLGSAKGFWCNILHLHGENLYFDAILDYPASIINWHDRDTKPTLSEAKGMWKGVVCGGLSRETLIYRSRAEILREARDAIAATSGRRFILSTGCVVPIIAPHGNLLAARESVESPAD